MSPISPFYPQCVPTDTEAGDGVDNDCDGSVDEEVRDGKDNDGDGKIDEDLELVIDSFDACTSLR